MRVGMVRRSARLFGLAAIAVAALGATRASAQPGHDAFDKPLGYDTGREEQAAHNYLQQTGGEDAYGDSQGQWNQNGGYRRQSRRGVRNQNGQQNPNNQNRRNDNDDDDAQHHAALGVSLRESDGHVTVIAVLPGSPAARAGLRNGDVIRYVGDQRIATAAGLAEEIGEYKPGSQVELSIRRNGEKQTLTANLGSRQSLMRDRINRNRDDARMANNQVTYNQNDPNNRGNAQTDGRRMRYSLDPANGGQRQQVDQRIQNLQQRLSQVQQELNNLRASLNDNRQTNDNGQSNDRQTNDTGRSKDNR